MNHLNVSLLAKCRSVVVLTLLLPGLCLLASGQSKPTDGSTPLALQAGAPAGSYSLSGFDNINLYNGALNFGLPLLKIGGRGEANHTVMLPIERHWMVEKFEDSQENIYLYPIDGREEEIKPGYGAGIMAIRYGGFGAVACEPPPPGSGWDDSNQRFQSALTRLSFTSPHGSEMEFRDVLTGGKAKPTPLCGNHDFESSGFNRGKVFVSVDGSHTTFISHSDIRDQLIVPITSPESHNIAGYMILADGTQYRIDFGAVRWIRDRNGNGITFGYPWFAGTAPTSIKDSLNREVTIAYDVNEGGQYGVCDRLTYKGFGGASRVVRICKTSLSNALRSGYSLMTWASLYQIYRRVVERRVYPDGGSGANVASRMTYSLPESSGGFSGHVVTEQRDANNALKASSKQYFIGPGAAASLQNMPLQVTPWDHGKENQTEALDTNGVVLRRTVNTWQAGTPIAANPTVGINGRVSETTNTIEPGGANLVSKQTFSYNQYNNQTDVYEYNFGSGAVGTLARRSHTDFLTTHPVTGADYACNPTTTCGTSANISSVIHLRRLPTQQQVFDGASVEKARTTYEYDNYANDATHAPLMPRSLISGHDAAFTASYLTRGNQTKVTNWILLPLTQVNSYSQYDIAGNIVEVIDARGYSTNIGYADCFGTPNGEARTNIAPNELATQSQTSYALATSVTNALGQTSYAQYDYYLGRAVDAEDINGIEASGYFSDALDRPTQVVRAVGTSVANQTTYAYDDTNRIITTTSDFDSLNDPTPVKSQTLYDGLGRTTETREYEGGTNYIAVQTQYDALGRAFKTSNPFRPWQSQTAVWTTSAYDVLGRITTVTTPDTAVVTTAYSGNTVTVTDQAGKKRKSVTDALGRLTQVYEDPTALNYLTTYLYDVLDNLTEVTQGAQTRTFTYDSLKRLKSAANPESGTINYTYDNNGNLLTKADAKPITITFTYDALNRPKLKNYSDTTPDVAYFYDAQGLPAGAPSFARGSSTGRLVAVTTGGTSAGTYRGYDELGQVVRQYQRTDSVNYLVEASYNKAGELLTEKYPAVAGATRTVAYAHDAAGRVASLSSAATAYAPAASVTSLSYAPHGALASHTLGNTLIHAQVYNNRLQPTQIKLGTSGNPASVINLTYNYGTTNNNGNAQSITYAGGGLSYTQTFGYDALNRLTTSQEGASWSQTNSYDRYGNRAIVGAALSFNAANNRITNAGYVYDAVGNLINDSVQSFAYDAENKIIKVNNVSAYVYDGEGQRVRKLVGENLRFIYGIGGQLVAEFSGADGTLKKEYIYGASGLVATIEPTAVNANGTRYLTSDHLSSPRVVTSSTAAVVSCHDFRPFGDEIGAGIGGRTTAMGFSVADGVRQKFTQKERDNETNLDYFGARYYASTLGRFTIPDPLLASGKSVDPQSWNRYAYVGNNPLAYIDPDGMLAIPLTDELQRQQQQQQNTNPYTKTTGNPADQAVDAELKKLFTDGKNGMVVGADAYRNQLNKSGEDSHYQLADGQTLHTIHVVGDEGGNRIVGVYAPEAFSQVKYEGGKDGIVSATNPNTGEVLGFAHVDVSSPAALQKNTQTTNGAGSRLLGNIGGPGADGQASAGNRHAHVTYYASAADRATARANKPATRTQMGDFGTKDAQNLRNFRTLVPKR